jgi:hypothetical protein
VVVHWVVKQGTNVVYKQGVEEGGDAFFVCKFEGAFVRDPR